VLPDTVLPVLSVTMPLVPLESEFALLSVTKPVEEDALAPLVITTSPPVWYAAVARPADSTRAAPAPLDPGPTTTLMLPAWPLVEAPVLNSNDPELPDELTPVNTFTDPLTPPAAVADPVLSVTEPEPDDVLAPL